MKKRSLLLIVLSTMILFTGCNQKAKDVESAGEKKTENEERWILENDQEVIDRVTLEKIEQELEKVDQLESEYLVLMPLEKIAHTNYIQVYNDTVVENEKSEEEKFHVEVCFLKGEEDDFELLGKDNLTEEEVLEILEDYFLNRKIPDTGDWYLVS